MDKIGGGFGTWLEWPAKNKISILHSERVAVMKFFFESGVRFLIQIDHKLPNRSKDLVTTLVVVTK